MSTGCNCSAAPRLIFACSGAADVGEISDRVARKLTHEGSGKMFCLAGIGGRVAGIVKTAETAQTILAIDGCPLNCAKQTLEAAGFTAYKHLQLADIGLVKGQSPANEETIAAAASKAAQLLA